MKKSFIFLIFLGLGLSLFAQSITNVRILPLRTTYTTGENVIIYWDYENITKPGTVEVKITLWREGGTKRICRLGMGIKLTDGNIGKAWRIPASCTNLDTSTQEDLTTGNLKIRVRWQGHAPAVFGETSFFRIKDVRRPDLIVSLDKLTRKPAVGEECNFLIKVKNVGRARSLSTRVKVIIGKKGTITWASPGREYAVVPMDPKSDPLSKPIKFKARFNSVGEWEVRAFVDSPLKIVEEDELNNYDRVVFNVAPAPEPDLFITDFDINPSRIEMGDTVRVQFRAKNIGNKRCGKKSWVVVYFTPRWREKDDYYLKIASRLDDLGPGESHFYSFQRKIDLKIPPGVTAYNAYMNVKVVLDSEHYIDERSEENNEREAGFYIKHLRPDLWIMDVTSPSPTRNLGQEVKIIVKVKNIGGAPVDSFLLTMKQGKKTLHQHRINVHLAPNQVIEHSFRHRWWTAGRKHIKFILDIKNEVDEMDEDNNTKTYNEIKYEL